MPLATADINWQGYGKVTDADNTTNWAVIKTTSGGGTPSPALADGGLQSASGSAQAITTTSNNKRILLYYDLGSGNELDFTASTGTEAGEFVWVWGNFLASSLLDTAANNGFGIMLGTDNGGTVDWSVWSFFGSDNYSGGWKRMVIDPTKTASLTGSGSTEGGGGITISSVRYFGIMARTTATARFDNMVVDRIDVGTGYAVDGTAATADAFMSDLLAVEQTTANWFGVIQSLNDSDTAYELTGKLTIGDSAGTTATTISDINSKIFSAEPLYYNSGFVAALPVDAIGIDVVGNGTGATSVTIGKAVGADAGRNGWTVVGNATYDVGIDWDDTNVNTNEWYGCSFEDLTGVLSWGSSASHKLFSSSFSGCEQFDPVGGIQIRNCTFSNTASTTGALLWNSSIDIQDSQFLANTTGEGIEHDAIISVATGTCTSTGTSTQLLDTGASFLSTVSVNDYAYNETDGSYAKVTAVVSNTELTTEALADDPLVGGTGSLDWANSDAYSVSPAVTYTDLTFSGNTSDVTNSATGSDGLFVSKSGASNPTTATGTIVYIASETVTITIVNSSGSGISGVQVSMYLASDDSEVINTSTNGSGVASGTFSGATPANVYIRWRKSSTGSTRYFGDSATGVIATGTGITAQFVMREDTIASA